MDTWLCVYGCGGMHACGCAITHICICGRIDALAIMHASVYVAMHVCGTVCVGVWMMLMHAVVYGSGRARLNACVCNTLYMHVCACACAHMCD